MITEKVRLKVVLLYWHTAPDPHWAGLSHRFAKGFAGRKMLFLSGTKAETERKRRIYKFNRLNMDILCVAVKSYIVNHDNPNMSHLTVVNACPT